MDVANQTFPGLKPAALDLPDSLDSAGIPTEHYRVELRGNSNSNAPGSPKLAGPTPPTTGRSDEISLLKEVEPDFDPSETRNRLVRALDWMQDIVIGVEPILKQNTLALLTGKHQLIVGQTGEAKTFLLRQLAQIFCDAKVFRITLTGTDREDALVGGIIMDRWLQGERGARNIQGSIIDCDIALINEFRDAHPRTLRVLNDVLNERELRLAGRPYPVRLHTAVACTEVNGDPPENLRAVLDRFQLKAKLAGTTSLDEQLNVDLAYLRHRGQPVPLLENNRVPMHWLRQTPEHIWKTISIPHHVLFAKQMLLDRWRSGDKEGKQQEPGHFLSKRSAAGSIDIIKAAAFLSKRDRATMEDLLMLQYVIPVVGSNEQHTFLQLARNAATLFNSTDCRQIDQLIDLRCAISTLEQGIRAGKHYKPTFLEELMRLLRLTSTGRLTFRQIKSTTGEIRANHPAIRDLQRSTLTLIQSAQNRIDYGEEQNLLE